MRKSLAIFVILISVLSIFANALTMLPKNYTTVLYIPSGSKLYDEFKKIPIGKTLMSDEGVGIESLVTGILQQQLMSMKYTLDDFDLFMNEILFAVDKDGVSTLIVGPVKSSTKVKKILEGLLDQDTLKNLQIKNNYFIFSEKYVAGGSAPSKFQELLKSSLAVSYVNISESGLGFEGYGTVRVSSGAMIYNSEITPTTQKAKDAVKQLQSTKPIDVFADKNVGGDMLIFINRPIPNEVYKAVVEPIIKQLNLPLNISGVAYTSADIGSAFTSFMGADSGSSSNSQNPSVNSYSVVFGTNFKMPDDAKKYVTIAGERYGVVQDENKQDVAYILIKSDRMITYTIAPNKYKPGDRKFFTDNYKPEYFAGVFINFEPMIKSVLGRSVNSSAIFISYIEGEKIIQRGTIK